MIKIIIDNDETGLTLMKKFDDTFFSTNDTEKMGKTLYDMWEMVSYVKEEKDAAPF